MMAKVRLRAVAATSSFDRFVSVVMVRGAAYHIAFEGDDSLGECVEPLSRPHRFEFEQGLECS